MFNNFGTDPEVFATNGRTVYGLPYIVPPIAVIKDYGLPFTVRTDGKKLLLKTDDFQIIEDGAAFEVNVTPTNNPSVFHDRYLSAIQAINEMISPFDLNVSNSIVGFFDTSKYWEGRDEDFRQCVIFGCDPDQSLYKDLATEPNDTTIQPKVTGDVDVSTYPYRFGGGHIHVEFHPDIKELVSNMRYAIGFMFDYVLQTSVVSMHQGQPEAINAEKIRLQHYGKPGTFRLQNYKNSHGFEFRPPSNWWLNSTFSIVESVLETASTIRDFININGEIGITSFMETFFDRRIELYDTLTTFNMEHSNKLHLEAQKWLSL